MKEGAFPKSIYEAIIPPKNRNLFKSNSAIMINSKILIIFNKEYESYIEKNVDELINNRIGDYLIKYTLGQGTFGKVNLGIYLPKKEKVAIKILEKKKILEYEDRVRIEKEIKILKTLRHPNIIHLYSVLQTKENIYLIMEYAKGIELFEYIGKKKKIEEIIACQIYQ